MPLEPEEYDRRAVHRERAAGVDPCSPSGCLRMLGQLPGIESLHFLRYLRVPGRTVPSPRLGEGFVRIELREGMTRVATTWFATHEGNEYVNSTLRRAYRGPDIESVMNTLAAATIVPRVGLQAAFDEVGFNVPALARWFDASQVTIALRIGEVFEWSMAIVGELWIPRRGPPYLPCDRELRRIVACGGHPAVRLVPLIARGGPRAAVFLAPQLMDTDSGLTAEMVELLDQYAE
jgi:hypothetical protein